MRHYYVLSVATAVYMLNLCDRGLVTLLLLPIKRDLQLTDSQLGLMTGMAFAFFYATLGLPIARWADRGNRVVITAAAIGLWGLTVMASTIVSNFVQLLIARICAAVGEAGCKPPTYSLIGDYFPTPAERTRAMAIYLLGNPLATLVTFVLGAWLYELVGWRLTFLIMGFPGVLLAALVLLTVREPRAHSALTVQSPPAPAMREVLRLLWERRSLRHICVALVLLYMVGTGLSPWYAAFLARSHGMDTADIGVWLGLILGLSGVVALLLGGQLFSRLFGSDESGQLRLSGITIACLVPCYLAFLLLPQRQPALLALVPLMFCYSFFLGPCYALMQRLVPDPMRATMLSVVMLFANLIGMGVGPLVVGVLSDSFAPTFGSEALRYAMLSLSFVSLWSGWHMWRAARTVSEDLLGATDIARRAIHVDHLDSSCPGMLASKQSGRVAESS
jgi:predicted MFS family arabinose efflux permease